MLRFRLRTLLVVVALCGAIAKAETWRRTRPDYLEARLLEIEAEDLYGACRIVDRAYRLHPEHFEVIHRYYHLKKDIAEGRIQISRCGMFGADVANQNSTH